VIILKDLHKTYAGERVVHALRGIDLQIPAGKIFGIIGQSGAGKSTLIRCINGLEKPDQGEVIFNGINISQLSPKELRKTRKKIGMIFQHFNLLSSRTVFDNVAFPLEIAGMTKEKIQHKVRELLELVGLGDKEKAYPHQLSGGQKQRVGIARALANEPQLLLCDEATSALDPETTTSILQLLRRINEEMGLTIVLITHEMPVIQEICDDVAVIEDGKIKEYGPVIDVFTKPQASATKRLLGGSIESQIPAELLQQINGQTDKERIFAKLSFVGSSAHEPIISSLLKNYDVTVNILFGKIDQMKSVPFGMLLVEMRGEAQRLNEALLFIREHDVEMEVFMNE